MADDNSFSLGYAMGQDSNGGGGNGNGMFGGDGGWLWIIVVFALLFGWNGNNGNGNGGGNSVGYILPGLSGYGGQADVQRGFDNQAVISKLDGITQGLCDSTYALNSSITNGFHGVDNAICSLGNQVTSGFNATQVAMMQGQNALQAQLAQCCCDNREAISGVKYDMATQACDTRNTIQNATRDIVENANANFRAIHDELVAARIQAKDEKIAEQQSLINSLNLSASQANQNQYLISQLRPSPVPAFQVPNPFAGYFGNCGGGYGNGCGCGC